MINYINVAVLLLILLIVYYFFSVWIAVLKKYYSNETSSVLFLLLLGLAGYVLFWAYYCSVMLGCLLSVVCMSGTLLLLLNLIQNKSGGRARLGEAGVMLLPVISYVLLLSVISFYPHFHPDTTLAANRWRALPVDNILPQIFANQLRSGAVQQPMIGDWLSSDRPPLQAGLYLMFMIKSSEFYQIYSMILQALVLLPFGLYLKHLGYRQLVPFAMILFGFSTLLPQYTLFVWPKLLSTIYLMILALFSITSYGEKSDKALWIFVAGVSAGLAMLSHGGAAFSLIAIGIVSVLRYHRKFFSHGIYALGVFLVLYLPWIYYQKVLYPPGDRLLKWHLAGITAPHGEISLRSAILQAYSALTFDTWAEGRAENLRVIFAGLTSFYQDVYGLLYHLPDALVSGRFRDLIINDSFFYTAYSLWFFSPLFLLGFFQILRGSEKKRAADKISLFAFVVVGYIIWILSMYVPGSTVIHQGSLFTWVLLFLLIVSIVWSISKGLFILLGICNILLFMLVYVPFIKMEEMQRFFGLEYIVLLLVAFFGYAASCFYANGHDDVISIQ